VALADAALNFLDRAQGNDPNMELRELIMFYKSVFLHLVTDEPKTLLLTCLEDPRKETICAAMHSVHQALLASVTFAAPQAPEQRAWEKEPLTSNQKTALLRWKVKPNLFGFKEIDDMTKKDAMVILDTIIAESRRKKEQEAVKAKQDQRFI
jgi:hypothetical protein